MVAVSGAFPTLGFLLALAAAVCYEGGYALQALEARRAPADLALRLGLIGHLLRRRTWVLATVLTGIGWPLQVFALAHAPLTLVQPTLALGLVLLLALGARVLREPVGAREIGAVAVIIAGVALIAWAAPSEPGTVSLGAGLLAALALLSAAAVAPYLWALAGGPEVAVLVLLLGAGAADGLVAFVARIVAQNAAEGAWLVALGCAAGVGCVWLLGFLSETTALQRARATRVAPVVLVLQVTIPVVLAPLVGGEGWGATPLGGVVLASALALVAAGTALLAGSRAVGAVIATPERDA